MPARHFKAAQIGGCHESQNAFSERSSVKGDALARLRDRADIHLFSDERLERVGIGFLGGGQRFRIFLDEGLKAPHSCLRLSTEGLVTQDAGGKAFSG